MDMKYMKILLQNLFNTNLQYYKNFYEGGIQMLKFLAKAAEKYAKATNTACFFYWVFHQPKMPASMIKKD